jgi:magnesium chelatase subunit H
MNVVLITLDNHLVGAVSRAQTRLQAQDPDLTLRMHAASEWANNPETLDACLADIETSDIIIVTMLFMEEQIRPVLPALMARREHCDALVAILADKAVVQCTKLGKLDMQAKTGGPLSMLKRLRGSGKKKQTPGAAQMQMLRRIPRMLRFIPGTAQDLRAYFLTMQYWLYGSEENILQLTRFLVDRYANGDRAHLNGTRPAKEPVAYPDAGIYHPQIRDRISTDAQLLPQSSKPQATIGLLLMRSYLLAGNTAHYDAIIATFEAKGIRVIPAFASGLDSRPAIDAYMRDQNGQVTVDAIVSLTGFSLVGGPAYNDSAAAQSLLAELDIPYVAALPLEFQSLEQWRTSELGLMPVEAMMMVALPELDGATGSMVFGGRTDGSVANHGSGVDQATTTARQMVGEPERIDMLCNRVAKLVALREAKRKQRRIGIVIFNFPPNAGSTGTAAYLSVFQSLFNTLERLKASGYEVQMPESADALRDALIQGNAEQYLSHANVHARVSAEDYVRTEPYLAQIEAQWGPAPGREQTNGSDILILGAQFGNVFIGVQPAFGYEGDPMRLLFEKGMAPTHAFSAFYRYLREDFGAHALLHFGTHGALEFMPGKQTGLSDQCWPDRLIGDVPNFYLYAANNPSEGLLAKRRCAATLISHLTPPLAHAGLYRGLTDLKDSIKRYRETSPLALDEQATLVSLIQAQAASVDLCELEPVWQVDAPTQIHALTDKIRELEYTLIPAGLHTLGKQQSAQERKDWLRAIVAARDIDLDAQLVGQIDRLVDQDDLASGNATEQPTSVQNDFGADASHGELVTELKQINTRLVQNDELAAIVRALDGRFIAPVIGGDLIRSPDILPTGRNIHGFDPYRMPSAGAMLDGAKQAGILLERIRQDRLSIPETLAMVLWGTDNLKTEGSAIAQALVLLGAEPQFDNYGRLFGAQLIPLEKLGRPRIDLVITLSGIFRDLLPQQCKLLAQATYLAATADEPIEMNFVRKHALQYQADHGGDIASAAMRVFSNASGAYGANVNQLVESSRWNDEAELAQTFTARKCFAFGIDGKSGQQAEHLQRVLGTVEATYQNLDSVELGVTTIDHYFDTLGGVSLAANRASGHDVPVYIGDHTGANQGAVRTLSEQIDLETRTRVLNPRWHEAILEHGYEGVHQLEMAVTSTMGWSATTGQVSPWIYKQVSETFVLDDAMRERIASLNPTSGLNLTNRLLEAHDRQYWTPDEETLTALRNASMDLEDQLEGVQEKAAA